ncbi:oxygen-independent coproporphyrinogen-3 oxidase [Candidatus Methanophagaceae archaeon]|nr:oxygen-independent coproporphyrinogen-3 oxidase [Methanophagales archaeon]
MRGNNTRKWLKSHHDTLFPFFPFLKKRDIGWLFDSVKGKETIKGALYIHIPFCTGRCTFCILTKERRSGNTLKYVNSILEEAKTWRDYFSPVEIIYIGGGTPTALSTEELKLLFDGLGEIFQIEKAAEISIETTVSELTADKINLLADLGVNRLSVGVQTFNPGLRTVLGRRSSVKEVIKKLDTARKVFPLLTIDFLYDLPGQDKRDVLTDLRIAMGIGIDGISLYPLIYNPKTVIARQFEQPTTETAMAVFANARNFLDDNGYTHVNINHFSNGRDKFRYSTYFNRLDNVLGLGAGATGFLAECFLKHKSTSGKYIRDSVANVFNVPEAIIPVLWCVSQLQYGRIDLEEPKRRWGFEPLEAFTATTEKCVDRGELIIRKNAIELTTTGMFWANTIGAEMAVEYLYDGKGGLVSLEEGSSKIAKGIMLNKLRHGRKALKGTCKY